MRAALWRLGRGSLEVDQERLGISAARFGHGGDVLFRVIEVLLTTRVRLQMYETVVSEPNACRARYNGFFHDINALQGWSLER